MEKSDNSNRTLILASGVLVAFYVTLQFSIYFFQPNTQIQANVETQQIKMPKEATLLNAALTYMISIVGIQKN